ncbi:MAG: hypothetical protein ABWZ64_09765 [Xanthobacteraceae bacterium]
MSHADAAHEPRAFCPFVEIATARYWTTMERHKLYVSEHGQDMPEVQDWRWSS